MARQQSKPIVELGSTDGRVLHAVFPDKIPLHTRRWGPWEAKLEQLYLGIGQASPVLSSTLEGLRDMADDVGRISGTKSRLRIEVQCPSAFDEALAAVVTACTKHGLSPVYTRGQMPRSLVIVAS